MLDLTHRKPIFFLMSIDLSSEKYNQTLDDMLARLNRWLPGNIKKPGPIVSVLRFAGPIGVVTPLRPGLSLSTVATSIQRAFSMRGAKAIAIQINSPGGSPVQSTLIYERIRKLADEKKLPVYVFAEDVAASGGYLLALAGDEIYADPSSIIGSIGVISSSFGFDKAIAKLGIERRVHTAGENKMSLDPFKPEDPDDLKRIKEIQKDIHATFIGLVKERRGERLAEAGDKLFSGSFWSGRQAEELGLIDGLSDIRTKMREKFGDNVRMRLVTPERTLFRRRLRGIFSSGEREFYSGEFKIPDMAVQIISAIEARALWSRFGL